MMRSNHILGRIGAAALVLGLLACGASDTDWVIPTPNAEPVGARIQIVGTVRYYNLEGGFSAILGGDAVIYDPTNLPDAFRKDGLQVEAVARRRDDLYGIHQVVRSSIWSASGGVRCTDLASP